MKDYYCSATEVEARTLCYGESALSMTSSAGSLSADVPFEGWFRIGTGGKQKSSRLFSTAFLEWGKTVKGEMMCQAP